MSIFKDKKFLLGELDDRDSLELGQKNSLSGNDGPKGNKKSVGGTQAEADQKEKEKKEKEKNNKTSDKAPDKKYDAGNQAPATVGAYVPKKLGESFGGKVITGAQVTSTAIQADVTAYQTEQQTKVQADQNYKSYLSSMAQAQSTFDSAVQNKLGAIGSAQEQADAQRYSSRYQTLSGALTAAGQLEGVKIQSLGQLLGIFAKSSDDFINVTRTEYLKQADQIQLAGNSTYQAKMRSRLARINAEYQIDLVSSDETHLSDMDKEALTVLDMIRKNKSTLLDKYKDKDGNLRADIIVKDAKGNELKTEAEKEQRLIDLVEQHMTTDIFKKYENKVKIKDFKTSNGFKDDYYLNDQDNKNGKVYEGELTTKVTSRLDNGDGTYKVTVLYPDGTTGGFDSVPKSRIYREQDINSSGLQSRSYVQAEEAVNIVQGSSGDRVDLFFGAFRKKINARTDLTEDEKEAKLKNVQTSLEAIFGGDKLLKGLLGLALSGDLMLFFGAVTEMIGGGGLKGLGGGLFKRKDKDADQNQNAAPKTKTVSAPSPTGASVVLTEEAKELKSALKGSELDVTEKQKLAAVFKSEADVIKALVELEKAVISAGGTVDHKQIAQLANTISVDLGLSVPSAGGVNVGSGSKKPLETPSKYDNNDKKIIEAITLS